MRRPAPLPRSAEQESEPAPRAAERSSRPAQGEIETMEAGEDATSDDPSTPDATGDAAESLTVRDVWRASRARRKALRAEIRRFTQRSRRRRWIWLSVLGALVLLVGGSAAAAYSPLFAVEKVTVIGASAIDAASVEAALDGQVGTPLALIDASEVKAALLAFPLIETYALEARPPHELTVRIVERTPIGVIASDAGFTLVDAAGVALSTTPTQPEGQPTLDVTGGTDSAAFESVGLVVRSLPSDVRAMIESVRATSLDDVTLTLASGVTVVWGSADQSVEKSVTLTGLMAARPDAQSFDVSSPEVGVVG